MSIIGLINRLKEAAFDYIFPVECLGCKKEGELICSACFNKIELITEEFCLFCQARRTIAGVCLVCQEKFGVSRAIAAAPYKRSLAGRLVEECKFNFVKELARPLAGLIARQVERKHCAAIFNGAIFVPIPLSKRRILERGFNQSEELAKRLALKYNGCVENQLIRRIRNTEQQARLSRAGRFENVAAAFVCESLGAAPERIILVDDILTTGATLIEAAKMLRSVGVKEITVAAVCHG